jgi:hypothetical protein
MAGDVDSGLFSPAAFVEGEVHQEPDYRYRLTRTNRTGT